MQTPPLKISGTHKPQPATSPVDKIMQSLVVQPGAPILTFGEPVKGKVSGSQKRFYLSTPASSPIPNREMDRPRLHEN